MEEEFEDISIGDRGEVLPSANNKILLIDADTVAYTACLNAEIEEQLLPRSMYTNEEWSELMSRGYYDEETSTVFYTNIEDSLTLAEDKLRRIKELTGALVAELYFTSGKMNFRYLLNPDYKGNRKGRTPQGLQELKEVLHSMYPGEICKTVEADDMVIWEYKRSPEKYILCSIDKDVIYSVPGRHFNYYESGMYKIDMKWVDVDEVTAMRHPFHQTITGDTTDNIKSPRGLGKKTADKILAKCTTPKECWDATVEAYENKKWTEEDAVFVMRQVNLHQLNEEGELELWDENLLKKQ